MQARADLLQQQIELVGGLLALLEQVVEEVAGPLQRQLHHVMDVEAGQGAEHLIGHGHRVVAVAQRRVEHRVGLFLGTDAKIERLVLQPRAVAGGADIVAAVLGEHDADVHLVGLALEKIEILLHPVPGLAVPGSLAVDDPALGLLVEVLPRGVEIDLALAAEAHQVFLALHGVAAAERLDRAVAQGERVVGDDQVPVDADGAAEAAAGVAGAERGVEGEEVGLRVLVVDVAVGAVESG